MCKEAIAAHKIPGAVALVARNGKIVYHKAFGTADPLTGRALRKDDIFRIASQTKAITATAVMMLWEEGHFRLDDPISKWIPEFKNPKVLKSFRYSDTTYTTVPAEREITIRHLLTHTSGIGYGAIDPHEGMQILFDRAGIEEFAPQREWSTADNIKQLASLPLHFQPGEKYQYGMGLDVLVYLVEIITGKPFEAFLQQRLFGPLGMEDTYFHLPKEKADRLVKVQEPRDSTWVLHQPTGYDPDYPLTCPPSFCSGGAGLVSTATDYATFLQMYLNGGELNGVQILSPTTIKAIMANQIGDFWGDAGKYYGLAFGVVNANGVAKAGIGSEGTFDWGGYFNTQYFADPEEQVIGIILKQSFFTWGDPTGWQFRQIVGQAIDDDPQGRNMSR
ncbi:MAG: class A beta-lactamase-related serine hydrolase [Bacteroidetes bacterium]|nr:MAG: class A beta-lactamase-related serine hydrolase [Bacteroidota bacterium]